MGTNLKKIMEVLGKAAVVLFFFGLLFFPVMFFGLMGAFPLYVTKAIGAVGVMLYLMIVLIWSGLISAEGRKRLWYGMLAVVVCAGTYVGLGAHKDSLASLEDAEREKMLWKYEPFSDELLTMQPLRSDQLQLTENQVMGMKLDGATALYPVYAGFVQAVYPEGEYRRYDGTNEDGLGLVTCTGTNDAYERLLTGETDMIFVAGPSDAQLARAAELGMELHMTPIGREAFVFFVNNENPVEGLTVEQVQGIYSGKITRWSEVGGRRQSIRAFQRAEDSGSQTALQRLMGDLPLMEPKKEDRIAGMGGIIRQVASYRNYKNALGFSFRFYCTEMVANGDIRLLALNGVMPTKESIRDGSYPVSSSFYAVTSAPVGEPAPQSTDDTIGAFINWILSEEGQQIVENSGYVSVK